MKKFLSQFSEAYFVSKPNEPGRMKLRAFIN